MVNKKFWRKNRNLLGCFAKEYSTLLVYSNWKLPTELKSRVIHRVAFTNVKELRIEINYFIK